MYNIYTTETGDLVNLENVFKINLRSWVTTQGTTIYEIVATSSYGLTEVLQRHEDLQEAERALCNLKIDWISNGR